MNSINSLTHVHARNAGTAPTFDQTTTQVIRDGSYFMIVVSQTFHDQTGQGLTYSATLADGSALPSWMSFNPSSQIFDGTVPVNAGTLNLSVNFTATNVNGQSATDTFGVNTYQLNPPVFSSSGQTYNAGQSVNLNLNNIASDPQGQQITFTVTKGDNNPLPSWLHFDAQSNVVSGAIPTGVGTTTLHLTAVDASGLGVQETFWLNINNPPVVHQTPNQVWNAGQVINLPLSQALVDPQNLVTTYNVGLPSWLHVDTDGNLTGTVPVNAGNFSLTVVATDSVGLSNSETFNVTTINPPTLVHQTADQNYTTGQNINIGLNNDFSDPQGQALTYSVVQANGSGLPSWLHVNNGTLIGTANASNLSLVVTATDNSGLSVAETFNLNTANAPSVPPTFNQIHEQTVNANQVVNIAAGQSFSDPQGETLIYNATLSDGSSLPQWISINQNTGLLSGTAPSTSGHVNIAVTATDTSGLSVTETIGVNTVITAPQIMSEIAQQNWNANEAVNLTLANQIFSDPQGQTLTYSVTQANGAPLPSWLHFDAQSNTFSGTVPTGIGNGTLTLNVVATDTSGLSAAETFGVKIIDPTANMPTVTGYTTNQVWNAGQVVNLPLHAQTFTDPQGETLTYSATQVNGTDLPTWLHFNAATETFSGIVPNNTNTLNIMVTATNTDGLSVGETFKVGIINPPTCVHQTVDQTVNAGQVVNINEGNDFNDPQGQVLTYSATQVNGTDLPTWLHIDPSTGIISGTVPPVGSSITINTVATNVTGLTANETVNLNVINPPTCVHQTVDQTVNANNQISINLGTDFNDPQGQVLTYSATQVNGTDLPTWLHINQNNGLLYGTALTTENNLNLVITAKDTSGFSVSENVNVNTVVSSPVLVHQNAGQSLKAGQTVNIDLGHDFNDPNGQALSINVFQATGEPIPSWLSLNDNNVLTGVVPVGTSNLNLNVIAVDDSFLTNSETVTINVINPPVVGVHTPEQHLTLGQNVNVNFGEAFSDPQGQTLTYSVLFPNGESLPSGLVLDSNTGILFGTINIESTSLIVTATDTSGLSVSETVLMTVNSQPTVVSENAIKDQTWFVGSKVNLTVPTNLFTDPQGQELTYAVTNSDGTPLPSWLSFSDNTLIGILPTAGNLHLQVTATDTSGLSASETFAVTTISPPALINQPAPQTWVRGTAINFAVPENTFVDPQGHALTYSAQEIVNGMLTNVSWLKFNNANDTFTGVVPANQTGTVTLEVTATNTDGASVIGDFNFNIVAQKAAPVISHAITNVSWKDGASFSLNFSKVFSDPNGENLTYSVHRAVASNSMPTWLHFNNNTLTGKVPTTQKGTMDLALTATNTDGLSSTDVIHVTFVANQMVKVVGIDLMDLHHNILM